MRARQAPLQSLLDPEAVPVLMLVLVLHAQQRGLEVGRYSKRPLAKVNMAVLAAVIRLVVPVRTFAERFRPLKRVPEAAGRADGRAFR